MMSLDVIVAVNEQIAARAARQKRKPFVPSRAEDVERWPPFPFPNIGYFQPPGWVQVESWFIDKTGHGAEWEPALTHRQFRELLRDYVAANPSHGFAIVEEGEFQAAVGAFRPLEKE